MNVTGGSTDVTTYFVLRLAADGTEATGLTITNFDLQYTRNGVAPTAKVDATALAATDSAHGDNQAIEIDGTDQPGLYRVDWPDAAFAAGVKSVVLTVKCATCFTEHKEVFIDSPVSVTSMSAGVITATVIADNAIDAGAIASDAITAAKIANGAIDAATFAADVDAEILSYIVDDATRIDASALNTASVTTIPAILVDTGTTLDGKIDTISTNVDSILADTGTDGVVVAAASKTGYTLSATGSAALTEGYAADGAAFTLNQGLYMIWSLLAERAISGTTLTAAKLDGTTAAMTFTLDDATTPNSQTRAT